jgi:hypothetical protein
MGGSGAGIGAGAVMGAAVNGVADEADVKGVDDEAVEMQASEGTRIVVGTRVGMGACAPAPAPAPAKGSLAPPRAPLGNGSAV